MSPPVNEFDVIIAGGGATACVIAGRLAAAAPDLQILVIEAGPHTQEDLAHIQPARYATHLLPNSKTVKFLVGNKSEALGGRSAIVPTGQCVGGGSAVNFAMYTRPSASDYDDWVNVYKNPGWGYKDMLPFFRKFETYQIQPGLETHGYDGPLKTSKGGIQGNVGEDFLQVAAKYDPQRGFTTDVNGFVSGCNEYGYWPKWINAQTGHRSDTAHHYLYNQAKANKNLVVVTGHVVKRVLFENTRAVGVEYAPKTESKPSASVRKEVLIARARRQVVVSAGSLGSPLILERSGIGSKEILEKYGVKIIVNLPGVGDKYQDHQGIFPPYYASEESDTLDGIVRGEEAEIKRWTPEWESEGKGLIASNGLDSGLKLRPLEHELKAIGLAFQQRWNDFYAPAPDKPIIWFGPLAMLATDDGETVPPARKYLTILYFMEHPTSTGHIHITSGDDVDSPPDFDPGYLTTPDDLAVMNWAYKRSREFARRMPSYRGEYTACHPKFPQGSEAECKEEALPVPLDAPDIKWTHEDEKAIEAFTRKFTKTCWHSLGTCAMKPRENGGVVDTRLNVYGVEGLKVADVSIAPGNVASNTYSTAVAVGERAAVFIAEELGIKGV